MSYDEALAAPHQEALSGARAPRTAVLKGLGRRLGPGIVAGAADDDPSGIATYSIAGAQFGTAFLWTALLTWPLMAAVQSMCARIGMVTGGGLAAALRSRFPRRVIAVAAGALLVANTFNIGADLAGMADAAELLTTIDARLWVILFGVAIAVATVELRYLTLAGGLKWMALVLLVYVAAALVLRPDWTTVLHDTAVPALPASRAAWATLVAILGTTISPYLFFWQASQEVEEEKSIGRRTIRQRIGATREEINGRKVDIGVGTLFSNLVMFFIILTTALTLHRSGAEVPRTAGEVARALQPLAGPFAALLYTVGIVGTGALAIPTLAGSAAYALAETFGWGQGMDARYEKARRFYLVVGIAIGAGASLGFAGVDPVRALYWSAVLNGLLAPFLLLAMLLVASDRRVMRGQPSSALGRVTVALTTAAMFVAGIAMFVG